MACASLLEKEKQQVSHWFAQKHAQYVFRIDFQLLLETRSAILAGAADGPTPRLERSLQVFQQR